MAKTTNQYRGRALNDYWMKKGVLIRRNREKRLRADQGREKNKNEENWSVKNVVASLESLMKQSFSKGETLKNGRDFGRVGD